MFKQTWKRSMILLAAVCMLWGLSRATSLRFIEQRDNFYKIAIAEQKRLGLTNRVQLFAKYPTPEISLCKTTRVAPGATAEVVLPGKFAAGSKFLYENDAIEVLKESATLVQYRATIKAAPDAVPCLTMLHAITPVSGGTAVCKAVYVGAMPEWEFSAANGWLIRLIPVEEKIPPEGGGDPTILYRADFFRRPQPKPFESFQARMTLVQACPTGTYDVDLQVEEASHSSQSVTEEYQKIAQRLADPKITPQEYEKLLNRMSELATKMQAASEDMMKKLGEQTEQGKRLEDFGCKHMNFTLAGPAASGNLDCREASGATKEVKITGTMKKGA